jgi:hypothetical protein
MDELRWGMCSPAACGCWEVGCKLGEGSWIASAYDGGRPRRPRLRFFGVSTDQGFRSGPGGGFGGLGAGGCFSRLTSAWMKSSCSCTLPRSSSRVGTLAVAWLCPLCGLPGVCCTVSTRDMFRFIMAAGFVFRPPLPPGRFPAWSSGGLGPGQFPFARSPAATCGAAQASRCPVGTCAGLLLLAGT